MQQATSEARETVAALGLDPDPVTDVYLYWMIEDAKAE